MTARSYATIERQEPDWLIRNFVQLAGVTYVLGEGGVGKTFLTADWAARITNGWAMPGDDQEALPPGSILWANAEDSAAFSLGHRIDAARANSRYVFDVTEGFSLPDGLNTLRDEIEEIGNPQSKDKSKRDAPRVRLVIIDPLPSFMGVVHSAGGKPVQLRLTSGNETLRQGLMTPLERFALDTGVSVIVIVHTTKSGRMAGSAAIQQAARCVLRISRTDKSNPIRTIEVEKTNVADDCSGALAYTLAGDGLSAHVEWTQLPEGTEPPKREPSCPDKVLAELQRAPGPVQKAELSHLVKETSLSVGVALTRLKEAGKVKSPKRGYWTTPEKMAESESTSNVPELEIVK